MPPFPSHERYARKGGRTSCLTPIYLVFNEGYTATRGSPLVRTDLCAEAIRLARLVRGLMSPNPPSEATVLLALMLLHDSRRDARLNDFGDLVVLDEQDRSLWNRAQIEEAIPLVEEALRISPGNYAESNPRSPLCIARRRFAHRRRTGRRSFSSTTSWKGSSLRQLFL